jgi:hypothetical protein
MVEKEKFNTFDLIVALRGGLPEKCDFCGLPYGDGRYPVPEEAGDWSCNECEAEYMEIVKQQEKKNE